MVTTSPWCSAHGATADRPQRRESEIRAALEQSKAAFHFASLEVLREIFAALGACTSHDTHDGTHATTYGFAHELAFVVTNS
jgi:hypothetical protein